MREIFQRGRQNGSWMLMPTLKNNDNGHLVGSTMNIKDNRCSPMPLPLARVSTTALSARAGGNHCQKETWGWNLLPWSSFTQTPPKRIWQTSARMYTNFGGCLGGANVSRRVHTLGNSGLHQKMPPA